MELCLKFLLIVYLFCFVDAQIGETDCTNDVECVDLPESVCETIITNKCVCPTAQSYIPNTDNSGCTYECGAPPDVQYGRYDAYGTTTGSTATYSCDSGFQLDGDVVLTCVSGSGWDNPAPTCAPGKLTSDCSVNSELCQNIDNAECNTGTCTCLNGYQDSGTQFSCDEINECNPDPCKNGGTCTDLIADYTCACVTGYEGTNCETNPDNCDPQPCENGATCHDGLAAYTCQCVDGYDGTTCGNNIDDCVAVTCQNGGTCVDAVAAYGCTCVAGYEGTHCETNIDECLTNNCKNGATCIDGINSFTCDCVPGYDGVDCGNDINECDNNNCQNGATCNDEINKFTCICVAGYDGNLCQNNIDECASNLCRNGATCVDQINSYDCVCVTGYEDLDCGTNIDDCLPDPCQNSGICSDLVDDYSCDCVSGYTGKNCQTDINDCDPDPCQNGAVCTDLVDDYSCACAAGYEWKDCDHDINDCAAHACINGATCVDRVNYYECTCAPGYDGTHCGNNINECTASLCENGATCIDGINEYSCVCVAGYEGQYCGTNIDECLSHTCVNGATCVDGVDGFTCACVDGYDGQFCQNDMNECIGHACQNGATCVDIVNGYTCTCVDGYSGEFCSTNDDDCATDPCQNGGTCTDGVNTYTCACKDGYDGNNCENNINECVGDPCLNGATCNDGVFSYTCTCLPGYDGVTCENNIDECIPPPCDNGGTCTDIVNGYYCTCVDGYIGDNCETKVNECTVNLCENGATCVDLVNTYQCICPNGYDGIYCQNDIDECIDNLCQNGASCNDEINQYTCTCVTGYIGTYCQDDFDNCTPNPCQNGGVCTDLVDDFQCTCTDGFTGLTCRKGLLGDECGVRAEVCAHIIYGECDSTNTKCVCSQGYSQTADATCDPVDCGSITPPIDGDVNHDEGTVYQSKAYFTCNTGYDLLGDTSGTCQADKSWDSTTPTCQIKECGEVSEPANGMVVFVPNTQYLGKAEFECNTGYTLNGDNARECLATGTWSSSSPSCVINDCGTLNAPLHGTVDLTGGTQYLSIAAFTCDAGYNLIGETSITCDVNSWGASRPTCQIKDCGILNTPANGLLDDSQGTTYGAVGTFSCNVGYDLVGDETRKCQASGIWSNTNPLCQIKECEVLAGPDNGAVDQTDGTEYQKVVTYTCDAGYDLQGVSTRTCKSDGQWSSTAPFCDKISCGTLRAPTNGQISPVNGEFFEDIVDFTCDTGYDVVGNDVSRECLANEQWSGTSPSCVIKDCGGLAAPGNGQVLTVHGTTYGQTAEYSCDNGYQVNGVASRTCEADGVWSASDPTCVILNCGPVANLTNGNAVYDNLAFSFGTTVFYSCNGGYEITGVESRVCQADGQWGDNQPKCTLLDCDEPVVIENGVARTPSGSQVGDLAIYECLTGFGLVGNAEVPCESSGMWGTVPECRLDCGTPHAVNNSLVTYTEGTLVGATATYTCNDGYRVSGDSIIACETSGKWSNEPFCFIILTNFNGECSVTAQCVTVGATCRDDGNGKDRCLCSLTDVFYDATIDQCLADCGTLPSPTNGKVELPDVTSVGQIAVYECYTGYALNTNAIRTCLVSGDWSGSAPLCVSGCPEPSSPINGNVTVFEGLAAGDTVKYYCNDGYTLVGEKERVCLTDSQWNGNQPSCAIECPVLENVEHGTVDLSQGHWDGSKASYICINDYALVGISTRTCEPTGRWTGVPPECVFAIFPDVLLVFGSLFIFLVLIDIFILAFCVYIRYFQKPDTPQKSNDGFKTAPALDEENETGMPPDDYLMAAPPVQKNKLFGKKPRPPRIAPETKRQILASHPPPKRGPESRVVMQSKDSKKTDALKKFFQRKSKKPRHDDMDTTPSAGGTEEFPQYTPATVKQPPKTTIEDEQTYVNFRGDLSNELQIERDPGYGTATSEENPRFNHSLETDADDDSIENLSAPDLSHRPTTPTVPGFNQTPPWKDAEHSSPKESKRTLTEEGPVAFRGRGQIVPPINDTPVSMDTDRSLLTEERRKKMKGTVNSYVPTTTRTGRFS